MMIKTLAACLKHLSQHDLYAVKSLICLVYISHIIMKVCYHRQQNWGMYATILFRVSLIFPSPLQKLID